MARPSRAHFLFRIQNLRIFSFRFHLAIHLRVQTTQGSSEGIGTKIPAANVPKRVSLKPNPTTQRIFEYPQKNHPIYIPKTIISTNLDQN